MVLFILFVIFFDIIFLYNSLIVVLFDSIILFSFWLSVNSSPIIKYPVLLLLKNPFILLSSYLRWNECLLISLKVVTNSGATKYLV